jgi:hypothetical protein
MDEEIVDWVIELEGELDDLEHCATLFKGGREIRVEREQSGDSMAWYYLYSSVFKGLPATQIHTAAAKLVAEMNAAANSARGGGFVIMRALPITVRADGSRVPMTHVSSDTGIALEHLSTINSDGNTLSELLWTDIVRSNFARDWFDDARREATKEIPNHLAASAARRREIIFAVCTLESYFFEWTRDIILRKYTTEIDWKNKLDEYFPQRSATKSISRRSATKSIIDSWKDVPKKLYRLGLIKGTPNLGGPTWNTFIKVYTYRNALIHAAVSWPKLEVTASLVPALDSKAELGALPAGWAIKIVAELIRDLNNKAGTATPDWLDHSTQT